MSGKVCAVFGCNNYEIEKNSRSFFRFPREKKLCDVWVLKCKRSDLDDVYNKGGPQKMFYTYKICSDHFVTSDFRNPRLFSQGLKRGSVPSQKLPDSSTFASPKRRSPHKRERINDNLTTSDTDHVPEPVKPVEKMNLNPEVKMKAIYQKLQTAQKLISKKNKLIKLLKEEMKILKQSMFETKLDLLKYFGETQKESFFEKSVEEYDT